MPHVIDLQNKHFVSEDLKDFYDESKIIKKGDIVEIINYNINNCTFEIQSVNNTIKIDENDLKFMHKVKKSD